MYLSFTEGPGSILGGVSDFNLDPTTSCVSFVCILSCVIFNGSSDFLLTTESGKPALVFLLSVLVNSSGSP